MLLQNNRLNLIHKSNNEYTIYLLLMKTKTANNNSMLFKLMSMFDTLQTQK